MTKLYRIAKLVGRGYLKVSKIHSIYFEEYGNPNGIPVVHLHGGPGSQSNPKYTTKFYNPNTYRVILFDQRGCGKSTPLGEIRENTTLDLVHDIEKLRKHLGIDKWIVSGGSWGSTLGLVYAQNYPGLVLALILRGVFTFRKFELDWVEKSGASYFFPDQWERFKNFIPKPEQGNLAKAYARRVFGKDIKARNKAIQIANLWEGSISNLIPKEPKKRSEVTEKEVGAAKVFYHYEINKGFLKEGEIMKNVDKIKNIPGIIIQGRYDMVCPPITAWELHHAWPKSKLEIGMGGHRNNNKALWKKFVEYTDNFVEE